MLLSWLLPKKSRSLQAGSRAFPGLVGGGFVRSRPLSAKRGSHKACLPNLRQLVGAAVELGGGVRVQRLRGDPGPLGSWPLPPTLRQPEVHAPRPHHVFHPLLSRHMVCQERPLADEIPGPEF